MGRELQVFSHLKFLNTLTKQECFHSFPYSYHFIDIESISETFITFCFSRKLSSIVTKEFYNLKKTTIKVPCLKSWCL